MKNSFNCIEEKRIDYALLDKIAKKSHHCKTFSERYLLQTFKQISLVHVKFNLKTVAEML
jgi:hypothetical protein